MIKVDLLKEKCKKLGISLLYEITDEKTEDKIDFIDDCSYLYSLSIVNISTIFRRNGTIAKFFNNNPYTNYNINNYFKINNIKMKIVGEPKKANEVTKFICTEHNGYFERSWNSVLNGIVGCSECSGIKRYSYEDIVKIVESKNNQFLSNHYKGVHEEYEFRCSCGEKYRRRMDVFIYQSCTLCPQCNGKQINTYETVYNELKLNHIILLQDTFENAATNIKIRYKCGYETYRTLDNIRISKYLCPHCNRKGYKRDNCQFYKEVYELVGDEYVFEGDYISINSKMDVTHCCGFKYQVTPHKFINSGRRCPICSKSNAEQQIGHILSSKNIRFFREFTFNDLIGENGGLLRFDFAVYDKDELKFLLEYDGEYHYHPIDGAERLKTQQNHDFMKNNYCELKNIELLRIPYWDKDNIEEILVNNLRRLNIWQQPEEEFTIEYTLKMIGN